MACPYKAIKINGKKHDEYRYIMEQYLGKKLSFNEVVHHINGDKKDNRIENLELQTRSNHSSQAMKGNTNSKGTIHNTHKYKDGKFWCNRCKRYLDKDQFWKSKSKRYGVRTYCKKCTNLPKSTSIIV